MKKMKRFFALFLAMAMVLGMSMTTFAAPGDTDESQEAQETQPAATTPAGITVSGVSPEEGTTITVKAYQIVKYNSKGYYEEVLTGTIPKSADGKLVLEHANASGDLNAPYNGTTADAVAELSKKTSNLPSVTLKTNGTVYYSDEVTAGTWMIIVEGSQQYLYNPAVVSVQQDPDGLAYGTLNFDTDTWGTGVYLKKSEPTIEKTVENASGNESVQYGDVLTFTVTADIPYYTDEISANGFQYVIADELTGLSLVGLTSATIADAEDADNTTLNSIVSAAITADSDSFTVDLSDQLDLLKKYPDKKITIVYTAKVTSEAELIIDEVNNEATLTYSTNDGTVTKSKTTEHYTFGISAKLSGSATEYVKQFVKINSAGDLVVQDNDVIVQNGIALPGAVFQVHIGSATGTAIFEGPGSENVTGVTGKAYITKEDGTLEITGLDADTKYYLVEVIAPTGYTLNSDPIEIRATKNTNASGGFTGYTITIGDQVNGTNFTYNKADKTTVIEGVLNPFGFKNTSLSELPSTGGIGTTIFTVGGCAIMILAAGMFFVSRRKASR